MPLEKGMTTLTSVLAWRIPWTEESGGLQSMRLETYNFVLGYGSHGSERPLPAMGETEALSLGWEEPLEKGIATHSSILA